MRLIKDEPLHDRASNRILWLATEHSTMGREHVTEIHFNEYWAWFTCTYLPCGAVVSLECDKFKQEFT